LTTGRHGDLTGPPTEEERAITAAWLGREIVAGQNPTRPGFCPGYDCPERRHARNGLISPFSATLNL
jgi:hypothetical protein